MANVDKRRTDERVPVNSEPFWFSSAIIDITDAGDVVVLKSFQALDGTYQILATGVEIIEAFDGSASFIFGKGTMATNAIGTVTAVDADYLAVSADITEATIGYYPGVGTTGGFGADLGAGTQSIIKGADSTVPVLYATITATNPTVGKARLHALLTKIPVA
jgi:hypothetical protein